MERPSFLCIACTLTLLAAGCATGPRPEPDAGPLTDAQVRTWYEGAQDPQRFSLTVYGSEGGPVFAGSHRVHEGDQVVGAYKIGQPVGAPMVPFRGFSGEGAVALIDTSSAENWLEFKTAAVVGAVPLGLPAYVTTPAHVKDAGEGYLCVLDRFRWDQMYVENALFFAYHAPGDLGALARGVRKPAPDAVLGMRLLEVFSFVRFDFPNGKIAAAATDPYTPSPDLLVSLPISRKAGGGLAVEGSIDGRRETFILDTAGPYALAVSEPASNLVHHVNLGDLVFRDVPCSALDEHGLGLESYPRIGLELLGRFAVTIDNQARLVHFERAVDD